MSMYSQQELKQIATVCCEKIAKAIESSNFYEKPFKHMVIDDFFPIELAKSVLRLSHQPKIKRGILLMIPTLK
jgi:endonuclease III-like uncharacterized protein